MPQGYIVAPLNPSIQRRKEIEVLKNKSTKSPSDTDKYIKLLESEISYLQRFISEA